jgi:hypothetical protein
MGKVFNETIWAKIIYWRSSQLFWRFFHFIGENELFICENLIILAKFTILLANWKFPLIFTSYQKIKNRAPAPGSQMIIHYDTYTSTKYLTSAIVRHGR